MFGAVTDMLVFAAVAPCLARGLPAVIAFVAGRKVFAKGHGPKELR